MRFIIIPENKLCGCFCRKCEYSEGQGNNRPGGEGHSEAAGGKASVLCREEAVSEGEEVTLAVRSENIKIQEECACGFKAEVTEKSFAAGQLRVVLRLSDGTELVASRYGINADVRPGETVSVCFAPEDAVFVDRTGEK